MSARIHSIVDRRQLQGCGKVKPKDGDDSTGDSGDGSGGDSAANLFYPNDRPRVVLYDVNHALVTYFCVFISAAILCASPVAVRGRSLVITLLPLVLPLTLYGYCVVQVVKGSGSNRSSISKKQDDVAPASFKARHLLQIIRSNVADIEEMGYGLSSVLGLEDDVGAYCIWGACVCCCTPSSRTPPARPPALPLIQLMHACHPGSLPTL